MSRPPERRPSTLAASRAIAAARPIPIPAAKIPTREPAPGPASRLGVGRLSAPALGPVSGHAPVRARATKAALPAPRAAPVSRDQRIVFTVVVCFLVCAGALAAVSIGDGIEAGNAKSALEGTFKVLHKQQRDFRVLNAHFATWPELAASGATLAQDQQVTASNADASHWYLSLRDQRTGVICDRTGELLDDGPLARPVVCRDK